MIITDQDGDFKIVPQYSTIKELAYDPNRTSLPILRSSIQIKEDKLAYAQAKKAWHEFGGTPI